MKLNSFACLALLASSVFASRKHNDENVFAYRLNADVPDTTPVVTEKDALVYLSDRLSVSDFYSLGENNGELISFIDEQERLTRLSGQEKPQMYVCVHGVDTIDDLFEQKTASFKFKGSNHFIHQVFNKLPRQFVSLNPHEFELKTLTKEMNLLSKKTSDSNDLVEHFKLFNEKVNQIWKHFTEKNVGSNHKGDQYAFDSARTTHIDSMKLTNDRFFINELSQLIHMSEIPQAADNALFFDLYSLLSIGRKIGYDSETYKQSKEILANELFKLRENFDISVFVKLSDHDEVFVDLSKRSKELNTVFDRFDMKKRDVNTCFTTSESCQVSTSNCNHHGVCTKIKSECWSCLCSPTHNDTTSKTTKWYGVDCSKKDVSSEANLILWTTLALLVLFVASIQLLYKVGSEPLPGVLDAATASKKST